MGIKIFKGSQWALGPTIRAPMIGMALLGAKTMFGRSFHLSKHTRFNHFYKRDNINGVPVRLAPLLAALGAPQNGPQDGPKHATFVDPQDGKNTTCCQSPSKRKLYQKSLDTLIYLIMSKVFVRFFVSQDIPTTVFDLMLT
jgi:hypothetical protein